MAITAEQKQLIISINDRVNGVLLSGGGDKALLLSVAEDMDEVGNIIKAASEGELNSYVSNTLVFLVSLLANS